MLRGAEDFCIVRLVKGRNASAFLAVVIGALVILSSGALAARVAHIAVAQTKPKVGSWQATANAAEGDYLSGGFKVTSKHYVTGFHGTIQPGGDASCGTGTVTVSSKQKIVFWTGNGWIIGKPRSLGQSGAKVSVTAGGQTVKGVLSITFVPPAAAKITGSGTTGFVSYGSCELTFAAAHG
jgi:hypothetical protein